jgi:hypothetical protein
LFTHPGAAVALRVGAANDVATVAAGGDAVTVAPIFRFVGSIDIAGTVGDAYAPAVDESPEPPATSWETGSLGCTRLNAIAAKMALPPTNPASSLVRMTLI